MTKKLLPDADIEALITSLNSSAKAADEPHDAPPQSSGADGASPALAAPPIAAARPERRWILPARTEEGTDWLNRLLAGSRELHGSDLLIVSGTQCMARVHGELRPLGDRRLGPGETGLLCASLVPDAERPALEAAGTLDLAFTRTGLGRFRCNVHRAHGHWAAAVRLLPENVPDLGDLNLPESLGRLADLEHGLVLVTGPTGSGKSTTLAALMKRVLSRRRAHVITIEDPVEYAHPHDRSVVEHIQIGRDATTFPQALRAAMRQDPDVLLIGEMRDAESIGIAITAAETGHLVLSTLHTGDGPQTVSRILDSYPAGQQEQVRAQLSISLAGVVSQLLLPRKDGKGRVPAVEVMVATHAVRNLIRQGKIAHLRSQISLERNAGMLALDRSLAELVKRGLLDAAMARTRARVPEEFDLLYGR